MESKPAVTVQKCSRITKNPFFNFLRCFRSQPENQCKSAITTAINGAAAWKKMPENERQPYREMSMPYRKPASKSQPGQSRSRSGPRKRRAQSCEPSRRRATSRSRKPAAKRRPRSKTVARGRKPATVRARSKTVRRPRKATARRRSRSRTARRARSTVARGRKPASRAKSRAGRRPATRGRPRSVPRARKRPASRSRTQRTTKRAPRPRVTCKKTELAVSADPCGSCVQAPPTQTAAIASKPPSLEKSVYFGYDDRSQRLSNEPGNQTGFNTYRESITVSQMMGKRLDSEHESTEKSRKAAYRP